jgi:purine-binding chemotaxis protein CheW
LQQSATPVVEEAAVATKAQAAMEAELAAEARAVAQVQQAAEQAAVAEMQAAVEAEAKLDAQRAQAQAAAAEQAAQRAAEQAQSGQAEPPPPVDSMQDYQQGDFQALFFSVAGLKLAVPLKSLGGIHQWKEPNTIFGKPDWYLGIMSNREEKLNVVDTARWVMPEKYSPELAESLTYKYLIMLGESNWGLACEALVTTEGLSPDDVQWRKEKHGKRPWLAGVVREKMCAILDVDALVTMLEKGLNSQD